jgi:hypothetical protein
MVLCISIRGLAFEGALHRDMGNIEVQDQNCAVAYFAQRGLIDATRVGTFCTVVVPAIQSALHVPIVRCVVHDRP